MEEKRVKTELLRLLSRRRRAMSWLTPKERPDRRPGRLPMTGVMAGLLAVSCTAVALAAGASSAPVQLSVSCNDIAGLTHYPRENAYRIVLGVIAVPPAYVTSETSRLTERDLGPWRYWEKAGIAVRPGKFTVTVTVPKAWRSRVGITWGNSHYVVSRLRFSGCATAPWVPYWGAKTPHWTAYAGGFFLRVPSECVPLIFDDGRQAKVIRFGVGTKCGSRHHDLPKPTVKRNRSNLSYT